MVKKAHPARAGRSPCLVSLANSGGNQLVAGIGHRILRVVAT
jgi:hypothetical protein